MVPAYSWLDKIPGLSELARTKGWPYAVSWLHRITGIILLLYVWYHIYTLSFLRIPDEYDAKMKFFRFFIFVFLEWLLAVPVVFHAFNGGRLILYEIFGSRNDESMLKWVFGLSIVYVLLSGLFMIMGNQNASPVFFWLILLVISVSLGNIAAAKIRKSGVTLTWKIQRITGAFLLFMIPAHFLFMHLQPSIGHDSNFVISRMQNIFIKIVDLALVFGVLYHGGYGLLSIAKDYIQSRLLQSCCALLIIAVSTVFGWIGIKLIILI
ncbi:MAG: hypothetical protein JRG97_13440 [Deltaproteobacteria bacterium]|nr:hypothetical protein [Deltaproteobacteria bacterium]MBW2053471.1 hypothetical protein [Deltaproteobacteria bacterium]MBW2142049.1 hypothetical protein [Deltaproteobacteria bacterium]MBW2323798.1 hypothetical protein [Deltaproteobacteria bacterium]